MRFVIVPVLLLILFLVLGIGATSVFARSLSSVRRAPRPRHWMVRLACCLAAPCLLVLVGIGTWRTVTAAYMPLQPTAPLMIRAPLRPVPPVPADLNLAELRYLLDVIVAEHRPDGWHPFHVESLAFNWPEQRGRVLARRFHAGPYRFELRFLPDAMQKEDHPEPRLTGLMTLRSSDAAPGAPHATETRWSRVGLSNFLFTRLQRPRLLSLAPPAEHSIGTFWLLRRAESGDPLTQISLQRILIEHEPSLQLWHENAPQFWGTPPESPETFIPAVAIVSHMGWVAGVLLLAAALAAQCFRWRSLALAGLLLAVVLYAVVLDRAVVWVHAGYLRDPQASVEARRIAAQRIGDTFFYRHTAQREVARENVR
jgi:hypothetical protein